MRKINSLNLPLGPYTAFLILAVLLLCTVFMFLSGCTAGAPFRWEPTEAQQQAADLAVQDITALRGAVTSSHEPIRQEAETAARAAQTYLGLPEERLTPVEPSNEEIIVEAQRDANQSQPTIVDATQYGLATADTLLTIIGSIAGTAGLGLAGRKVLRVRNALRNQREVILNQADDIDIRNQAVLDLVRNIQAIKNESPTELRDGPIADILDEQSDETKDFVAVAKAQR